jgi:hypothetical protein
LALLITEAHGDLLFSSKHFVQLILERLPLVTFEVLDLYYRLTRHVNSFALTLKTLLAQISNLDEFTTELFACQNHDIIKAYLDAMDKLAKEKFIEHDLNQLVHWRYGVSSMMMFLFLLKRLFFL